MNRRRAAIAAVVLVIAAGGSGLAVLDWRSSRPLAFDRMDWDAHAGSIDDDDHTRHRMADRLVESGQLLGVSHAGIVELLGAPPAADKFRDWDIVYPLGPERGFAGIDHEWLVLRLDDGGVVVDARVVAD